MRPHLMSIYIAGLVLFGLVFSPGLDVNQYSFGQTFNLNIDIANAASKLYCSDILIKV